MFRQTHIRLTLLNSLVFIVLISILGSIIYFYTKGQLYQDVDHSLLESVESFQNKWQLKEGSIGDDQGPRQIRRDPRIMTLFWNEDQQLLENRTVILNYLRTMKNSFNLRSLTKYWM